MSSYATKAQQSTTLSESRRPMHLTLGNLGATRRDPSDVTGWNGDVTEPGRGGGQGFPDTTSGGKTFRERLATTLKGMSGEDFRHFFFVQDRFPVFDWRFTRCHGSASAWGNFCVCESLWAWHISDNGDVIGLFFFFYSCVERWKESLAQYLKEYTSTVYGYSTYSILYIQNNVNNGHCHKVQKSVYP